MWSGEGAAAATGCICAETDLVEERVAVVADLGAEHGEVEPVFLLARHITLGRSCVGGVAQPGRHLALRQRKGVDMRGMYSEVDAVEMISERGELLWRETVKKLSEFLILHVVHYSFSLSYLEYFYYN